VFKDERKHQVIMISDTLRRAHW